MRLPPSLLSSSLPAAVERGRCTRGRTLQLKRQSSASLGALPHLTLEQRHPVPARATAPLPFPSTTVPGQSRGTQPGSRTHRWYLRRRVSPGGGGSAPPCKATTKAHAAASSEGASQRLSLDQAAPALSRPLRRWWWSGLCAHPAPGHAFARQVSCPDRDGFHCTRPSPGPTAGHMPLRALPSSSGFAPKLFPKRELQGAGVKPPSLSQEPAASSLKPGPAAQPSRGPRSQALPSTENTHEGARPWVSVAPSAGSPRHLQSLGTHSPASPQGQAPPPPRQSPGAEMLIPSSHRSQKAAAKASAARAPAVTEPHGHILPGEKTGAAAALSSYLATARGS